MAVSEREMRRYRVYLTIRGGISRPSYDGHVDVWAYDDVDAEARARRDLKRGVWSDVGWDAFRVTRVERRAEPQP